MEFAIRFANNVWYFAGMLISAVIVTPLIEIWHFIEMLVKGMIAVPLIHIFNMHGERKPPPPKKP